MTKSSESFESSDDSLEPKIDEERHNGSGPHKQCKVPSLWNVCWVVEDRKAGDDVRYQRRGRRGGTDPAKDSDPSYLGQIS